MPTIKNFFKKLSPNRLFPSLFKKKELSSLTSTSIQINPDQNQESPQNKFKNINIVKLEKYYPAIIILLLAFFASDLTILFLRSSLLPTSAPPSLNKNLFTNQLVRMRTEYSPITDRNIFNADGIIPDALFTDESEALANNGPAIKSNLPIDLIGTIVHANPAKSVATIKMKANNEVIPYLPNDPIANIATLIRVERKKAIIRNVNTNQIEYIEIPEQNLISFAKSNPQTNGGPFKQEGNNYEIKRSDLDGYLKNLPDLLQQATAVPNIVPGSGGEVDGFKMLAIEPNSIFNTMGLKAGDVIKGVNGENVNSPAKAMELYNQLRSEGKIELQLERDGKSVTLYFNIN